MMLPLTLALSLLGCSQIKDLLGQSAPPPPVEQVKPVEPPKPKVVITPLLAGKYAEALPDLEKALAATPTDDAAWDAVEIAAVRGGQAGALLDRLSADQAIGGRVDRHQALRAELALTVGRAADALAAARILEGVNAGDGAALTVRAIQAGAPKPEGLPPVDEAFLKAATDKAAPLSPEVEGLTGARAALLRGEIKAERGDATGGLGELDGAAGATGVLATRVATARITWESDPGKGWTTTTTAIEAATKAQDLTGATLLLDAGKVHAYRQWKPQTVVDAAAAARKTAEEFGNLDAAAGFAGVQADALMHLGHPAEAKAAAEVAAAQPGQAARGKWRLALANAMLGDARAVAASAAGLPEADAKPIRELASAMNGGENPLPSAGLTGDEAAWQALLGAGWVTDTTGAAARAATAARSPDLKLWAQLWTSREPLGEGPGSPQMATENAVRAWVKDRTPGAVVDSGHPYAAHWRIALAHGTATPSDGDVAAFARLVSSVEGAFADQAGAEMNDLSSVLPDWRSGPLAPVVVLDGPRAEELEQVAVTPSRLTDEDALSLRVTWHAWRQREADRKRLWTHGVSPVAAGLGTPERLTALWEAVARQRAAVLAWVAGEGPYPTASAGELDNAAVELRLLPRKAGTLDDVRAELGRSALLSYVPSHDGGWEALYLTDHGYRREHIDATVVKQLNEYLDGLHAGKVSVAAGNELREVLIDPAADLLTGYGNYYVVGPAPLGALPVDALPEQSEGLRYLAAIRHTFYYSNFAAMNPPTFQENDFTTTLLAVVGSAKASEMYRRMFPDAVVLEGAAATRDAWLKEAPRARFLAFQDLEVAPSGGFLMPAGGALDLSDIAATPLVARTVAVSTQAEAPVTLARLSTFRAAGAGDFFATGVGSNKIFNEKMTERFWDSTNKRLPVWKALSEPRMQVATELDDTKGPTTPPLWGGLMCQGKLQ